ncbi:putative protein Yip5/YIPF1/YIPF2 [Helianthus annuus]|uniref:Protein YIP n=1 Tax=Helianthus annuus TaxID=4232 RepID=A0A9K3J860_HELAN|nr:putative protein Yip5/YIPF1/YIPF2 [Helianthus annuus]
MEHSVFQSYTQYFNVDTDDVVNRLTSSLYPTGDFFRKIEANPDLYGLIWISTTLVFVIASFGNCATYLTSKKTDSTISWSFDVNYSPGFSNGNLRLCVYRSTWILLVASVFRFKSWPYPLLVHVGILSLHFIISSVSIHLTCVL